MGNVSAHSIAEFLESELIGENIEIHNVSSLKKMTVNTLLFSKSKVFTVDKKCLILVPLDYIETTNKIFSVIRVKNPRLAFAKIVKSFFSLKQEYKIDNTSKISDECKIAKNVSIGSNCFIGMHVEINENTIINNNVVISDNTKIGSNCYIKSGTVIGEDGFGFDFEEDGTPVRIPHLGSVVIGNYVEIGAKNTIIENNVKIDDQVHIAHNCRIGANTMITACAEISGSVQIGRNCWIAPNVSIIQKVSIGDNVTIGIGAIITKDIADNKKIMGLESLELRSLLKVKKRIDYGR